MYIRNIFNRKQAPYEAYTFVLLLLLIVLRLYWTFSPEAFGSIQRSGFLRCTYRVNDVVLEVLFCRLRKIFNSIITGTYLVKFADRFQI